MTSYTTLTTPQPHSPIREIVQTKKAARRKALQKASALRKANLLRYMEKLRHR